MSASSPVEDCTADAAMLIGDRGMQPVGGRFEFVWDMGGQWSRWTRLPFVCAMWSVRCRGDGEDLDLEGLDRMLSAARDQGVAEIAEIARLAAPTLGLAEEECLSYLSIVKEGGIR